MIFESELLGRLRLAMAELYILRALVVSRGDSDQAWRVSTDLGTQSRLVEFLNVTARV